MNIVILFRTRNILDDFREAYFWLRQNTDEHARVMSWWDYGYQIAGMANRTTLVDNNTWNNSHIALVRAWPTKDRKLQPFIHYLDIRLHLWLSRKTVGESTFCLLNFQHTSLYICSVKWFKVCFLIWLFKTRICLHIIQNQRLYAGEWGKIWNLTVFVLYFPFRKLKLFADV